LTTGHIDLIVRRILGDKHEAWNALIVQLFQLILNNESAWQIVSSPQPYNHKNVQRMVGAGTEFFDLLYTQVAALYHAVGHDATFTVAPNNQFNNIYNAILEFVPEDRMDNERCQKCMARGSNDKGNSLEALMLWAYQEGYHQLVISMAYVVLMLQYPEANFSHKVIYC
jgi:hypothetical protein